MEGLGHRLRRGVELELIRVAIATHRVLADIEVPLYAVVGPYLEVLDSELHRVVSGLYLRVAPPCGALPAAVGELLAILVVVGPVPTFVPALVAVSFRVLVALVEGLVVPLLLPLDAVVCQGERGWGLLAWPVVVEAVRSHVAGAPVHLLVEIYVDVHAAGVFRGLHVEGLGHRLRRGVELEIHVVVLAPCHVLADVGRDADAVVCPYIQVVHCEHHRVVSGLYLRVVPPCGALPAAVG